MWRSVATVISFGFIVTGIPVNSPGAGEYGDITSSEGTVNGWEGTTFTPGDRIVGIGAADVGVNAGGSEDNGFRLEVFLYDSTSTEVKKGTESRYFLTPGAAATHFSTHAAYDTVSQMSGDCYDCLVLLTYYDDAMGVWTQLDSVMFPFTTD